MNILRRMARGIYYRLMNLANRFIKPTAWYRSYLVDPDHQRYPDNVWYREHDDRNFDVVNLGSSSGKWAFDWSTVPLKGMNWSNQPQTLIDDFRLFKNFHSILKKGGTVLITIMPFTGLNKQTGVMDTLKYLDTLYFDVVQDMPYLAQAQRLRSYPILFGKPAIKAAIKHLLCREHVGVNPSPMLDHNPMSSEELERDAAGWMTGWSRQFGISDFEAPLTPQNEEGRRVRINVMRELIDFITERDYKPYYIIPPIAAPLARHFTPKFKDLYIYDFLRHVDRPVTLLDYSNDLSLQDSSLYFNSFFLNRRGRVIFTERIVNDLKFM